MKNNDKKAAQLGMPIGTAGNRLRKAIIFKLLEESNQNFCFQCGAEIESVNELSIEHKVPYLDSGKAQELYFDLDNIGFSHLSCNCSASRRNEKKCGTLYSYNEGCRCPDCTKVNSDYQKKKRMAL